MTLLSRLFILVVIALAPSIVVLTYNQIELYQTQLVTIENDIQQTATRVAVEQEQATEAVRQLLVAVSSLRSVREPDSAACNIRLTNLASRYPNYAFIGVV